MAESGDLFQEWRTADRNARALEQQILRASLLAIDKKSDLPAPDERERAKRLRSDANDLFQLAMAEMERRAAAVRRL